MTKTGVLVLAVLSRYWVIFSYQKMINRDLNFYNFCVFLLGKPSNWKYVLLKKKNFFFSHHSFARSLTLKWETLILTVRRIRWYVNLNIYRVPFLVVTKKIKRLMYFYFNLLIQYPGLKVRQSLMFIQSCIQVCFHYNAKAIT